MAKEKKSSRSRRSATEEGMRLNKFVAHCGICSRRRAAELVKQGEIMVNGKIERNPASMVTSKDRVTYKERIIRPEKNKVYYLLNKPKDTVTTTSDERGRKTVMDLLKNRVNERIYPVGRLDRATTGLLLLTNDGDLAKKLSHPKYRVPKVYQVTLDRALTKADLERIRNGVELEDGLALVDGINYVCGKEKREVGLEIHIGKNRIVRRLFEHLGYRVHKLDRMYYAGLTKKDLPRGRFRKLTEREIIMLRHFT